LKKIIAIDKIHPGSQRVVFPVGRQYKGMYTYILEERKSQLERIITRCSLLLGRMPEGKLHATNKNGKHIQYFSRTNKQTNGKYLSKRHDSKIIAELARKKYLQKVLQNAREELEILQTYMAFEKEKSISAVYGKMPEPERKFFTPEFEKPISEMIEDFKAYKVSVLPTRTGSYLVQTARGDLVRSQAEQIIADSLYRRNIPYHYEDTLTARDGRLLRPDFTIMLPKTGQVLRWEHLGMMDRESYRLENIDRLESYLTLGILPGKGLILTFSLRDRPLTKETVEAILDQLV